MLKNYKIIALNIITITLVAGGVLLAATVTTPPSETPDTTFYTLEDIYGKLTDSGYSLTPTHDLFPTDPTSQNTMYSLSEIYDAVPPLRQLDGSTTTMQAGIYATTTLTDVPGSGLAPENIKAGVTIFGVEGTL